VLVVQKSAGNRQSTVGRSSRPLTLPLAQHESQLLIANDNPTRIVILSDQRESKGLPSQSLPLLIANLELEFHASARKQTAEPKSNRKYFAISCAAFQPSPVQSPVSSSSIQPPASSPQPPAPSLQPPASSFQNLIETPRLEFHLTPRKQSTLQISNRDKIRVLQFAFVSQPLSSAPNLAIIDFPTRGHL
jgi:hypothetical protein